MLQSMFGARLLGMVKSPIEADYMLIGLTT
jgi:hypothetical protein